MSYSYTILLISFFIGIGIQSINDNEDLSTSIITLIAMFYAGMFSILFIFYQTKKIKIQKNLMMEINLNNKKHRLNDTLNNTNFYGAFMQHLINELSLECLLSFTEFKQYRIYGINLLNYKEKDKEILDSFGENAPRSSIVFSKIEVKDKKLELKYKAYNLFEKYINIGSKFEINIASGIRNWFIMKMKDKNIWLNDDITEEELIDLFKKVSDEMYYLMEYSHNRFVTTKEFQHINTI